MEKRIYLAIDLKSFYASVECAERHLDPLTANLVVADRTRTEKTICLAVSPSLKAYGIPGRSRLFEVEQAVKEINRERLAKAPRRRFSGSSFDDSVLRSSPELKLDYIAAPPRMALYMDYSARIYQIYLRYAAPEDIHVYSIDEVFIDITSYLEALNMTPYQLAGRILGEIRETVGITAAAGIGTNLYLCKIALDIQAKHVSPDASGARIALLDESSYRRELWDHRPITDFWRVGSGYAGKLARCGLYTMGDIARCSLGGPRDYHNEDLLYRLFGVNAELLIDHAWGWEPCTMADIKAYRPEAGSIGSGQVLHCPYPASRARLVLREMADALSMDLVRQSLSTHQLVLTVGYDIENLRGRRRQDYRGEITTDRYGRPVPRHARGTENLDRYTSSSRQILEAATALFDRITDPSLLVRRLTLTACHVLPEDAAASREQYRQLNLFTDYPPRGQPGEEGDSASVREKNWQKALLQIRRKYGKNAVLRGMSLQEGATARDRNRQIGGHRA